MKSIFTSIMLLLAIIITAQDIYFPPIATDEWETIDPADIGWCSDRVDDLIQLNQDHDTKGLIILKDGKIAIESYFNGHDKSTNWYWASAGKSLMSVLVGIAQQDGQLHIDDLTSDYLGDWTSCATANNEITIRHQITMTTGLDYTAAQDCTAPECLTCLNDPGSEWYYHNAPYTLVGAVLESATGQTNNQYIANTLRESIGLNGFWVSLDDLNVYFSTTRSMARFGTFMLAGGSWDGNQIMTDQDYYYAMITPSQEINRAYGYLWWLNGQVDFRLPGSTITFQGKLLPDAADDIYAAIGKNGQYLINIPSDNVTIVRMGEDPDESLVPLTFIRELLDAYQLLSCETNTYDEEIVDWYCAPSLATDYIECKNLPKVMDCEIWDATGNLIKANLSSEYIDVSDLPSGIYLLRINELNAVKKFIKM